MATTDQTTPASSNPQQQQDTPNQPQDQFNTTASTTSTTTPAATSEFKTTKRSPKPFPSVKGSCICGVIRFQLLTSPLFVYACHCPDCQKTTGSAFGSFLTIETSNIALLTPTTPKIISQTKATGSVSRAVTCPTCHVELWSASWFGRAAGVDGVVADVRVGTLDFASLFEPDWHAFVESKVGWLKLPEGARTSVREYDHRKAWPKQSLRRLDACLKRAVEAQKAAKERELSAKREVVQAHVPGEVLVGRGHGDGVVVKDGEDGIGDGEKTPTAGEFVDEVEGEDDEAFEKRYRETERVLKERLEKVQRKLDEEQKRKEDDMERLTRNLELDDSKSGKEDGKI